MGASVRAVAAAVRVFTVKEIADYLRIHPTTVYRLLKARKIPAFRVGSDWRFNLESINRWVEENSRCRNLRS
jgi:excisionase family DNA binding protein